MAGDKTWPAGAEGPSLSTSRYGRFELPTWHGVSSVSAHKGRSATTLRCWRSSGRASVRATVDCLWAVCCCQHWGKKCLLSLFIVICLYLCFINSLIIKRLNLDTSEALFFPRDGRNHLRYSLHLPTEGWPGWVAWINTGMIDPPKVVTNPSTNWARRSLTSLMWRTSLLLRQMSHHLYT